MIQHLSVVLKLRQVTKKEPLVFHLTIEILPVMKIQEQQRIIIPV